MKQRDAKSVQTISLSYSNAKSTLKLSLTFNNVENTRHENFNFAHLSSFDQYNSTTIWCRQMVYIPNDCSATGNLSFLVWGSAEATTGELWPQNRLQRPFAFSLINFWGFCLCISGVACIVKPHLDY